MEGDSGISMQEEAKRLLAEHRKRTKELREAMEVEIYDDFLSLVVVPFVVLVCIDVNMSKRHRVSWPALPHVRMPRKGKLRI